MNSASASTLVCTVKIVYNVLDLLSLQANGVATPFALFLRYYRISVLSETAHEVTVILVDQRKSAILEKRQIKKYEPSLQPRPGLEQGTVVRFLVRDLELLNRLLSGIVEQVELRSSLLLVPGFVLLRKQFVKP